MCRSAVVAISALSIALASSALGAQSDTVSQGARPTGFRIGWLGWLGQPYLGGDAHRYLEQYGDFGWRPGGSMELGVDFKQFALSAVLDYGWEYFEENQASHVAAISLAADWIPSRLSFSGWQPLFSIGAIHEEIDMAAVNTGSRVFDFPFIRGDGARLAIALEHKLGDKTAFLGGTSIDLLSVTQQSWYGTYGIDRDGWALYPRFALGLRWWPFARRTR